MGNTERGIWGDEQIVCHLFLPSMVFTAREPLCARNGCSGLPGCCWSAWTGCFGAANALKMAAQACPGAASALEKAALACCGAASALKMAVLTYSGAARMRLKSVFKPASVPPVRSKTLFEPAVRDHYSKVLVSVSLFSEPLHSALLYSVHGYARVHTSIYI